MSKTNSTLTAERLRELLHYDQETGDFTRKIRTSNRVTVGKIAAFPNQLGYLYVCIEGSRIPAHRLAWLYITGKWPENDIDHIDGRRSNNQFKNLRDVSRSGNAQNQRCAHPANKTGLLGVTSNGKRWTSRIRVQNKNLYLGTFDTPQQAHEAYLIAKRKYHPTCTI